MAGGMAANPAISTTMPAHGEQDGGEPGHLGEEGGSSWTRWPRAGCGDGDDSHQHGVVLQADE
jgi:hypothetical protein